MWNLFLFISLLPAKPASPGAAPPAGSARDCQQRISHAYDLLDQVQREQRQGVLELRFTTHTTYRPPGKKQLTTTIAHFTLLRAAQHTYLTNGEAELYQDGQVQVSVSRAQRTILITATQAQLPNALLQLLQQREQMKTQTVVTACAVQSAAKSAERLITAQPLPGSSMTGRVASLAYRLDARTDALRQLTLYYPASYGLYSAAVLLESLRIKARDPLLRQSALRHVFGPGNQLLPAYRSFTVQDQRGV